MARDRVRRGDGRFPGLGCTQKQCGFCKDAESEERSGHACAHYQRDFMFSRHSCCSHGRESMSR